MTTTFPNLKQEISSICSLYGKDRGRMMDIVRDVQEKFHCVPSEALDFIASEVGSYRVEVESVVSFYTFLSKEKKGKIIIRLCDDIIDRMSGVQRVAEAFKQELGISFGETLEDGSITLEHTPCIGMCDQAPAALINDVVVTNLSTDRVVEIVKTLRASGSSEKLVKHLGDGNNGHPLVKSMVRNMIRKEGDVIFSSHDLGKSLKKAIALTPTEVIKEIKAARLRGRGGAGFPTGMKWEFTRAADKPVKTVICNADEGEPGTFKDRAILTEKAGLVFEGMAIGGYAIGAETGILYLRAEYSYLKKFLDSILADMRSKNLLGQNICGRKGFNFDIRIQMGAGAYICGEETALISSCEGLRGDPKNRPPFPAQQGYLKTPTSVNNVETFCCVVHIIDKGAAWFASMGSKGSTGTKVLSISGDCTAPGVYEFPFGTKLSEILKIAGAEETLAVQLGGPSGQLIGENDFERIICYDDLATGGSLMIFNKTRNILEIVKYFMEFFIEESCGYCTPCRVGNVLLKEKVETIIDGKGLKEDLTYLLNLCKTVKLASRCGLGQTSSHPVSSSLKNFKSEYEKLLIFSKDGRCPTFDITKALLAGEKSARRKSVIFDTI